MELREHNKLKFKGRHYSVRAFVSIGHGAVSLIGYIVMAVLSEQSGGNAGFGIGVAGLFMAAVAVGGLIIGLKSLKERDIYMSFVYAGVIVNSVAFVIYLISYVIGLL